MTLRRSGQQLEAEPAAFVPSSAGSSSPRWRRRREELSELTGRVASLEELVAARAHFGAGARHLLTSVEAELGYRSFGLGR